MLLAGAACVASVVAAPAQAALRTGSPYSVSPPINAQRLSVPGLAPRSFAVAAPGFALVPLGSGVALAGLGGWFIDPKGAPVIAVAANQAGDIAVLRAEPGRVELSRARRDGGGALGRFEPVAALPPGSYQMVSEPGNALWIWGCEHAGQWVLLRMETELREVLRQREPIDAVAPFAGAVLVARGRALSILRAGGAVSPLAEVDGPVDGLVAHGRGHVYFSTDVGVFRLATGGRAALLARGLHGPMRAYKSGLYVLSRERREVVLLRPKPRSATPP